jgi:hypothetical protein
MCRHSGKSALTLLFNGAVTTRSAIPWPPRFVLREQMRTPRVARCSLPPDSFSVRQCGVNRPIADSAHGSSSLDSFLREQTGTCLCGPQVQRRRPASMDRVSVLKGLNLQWGDRCSRPTSGCSDLRIGRSNLPVLHFRHAVNLWITTRWARFHYPRFVLQEQIGTRSDRAG